MTAPVEYLSPQLTFVMVATATIWFIAWFRVHWRRISRQVQADLDAMDALPGHHHEHLVEPGCAYLICRCGDVQPRRSL